MACVTDVYTIRFNAMGDSDLNQSTVTVNCESDREILFVGLKDTLSREPCIRKTNNAKSILTGNVQKITPLHDVTEAQKQAESSVKAADLASMACKVRRLWEEIDSIIGADGGDCLCDKRTSKLTQLEMDKDAFHPSRNRK